MHWVVWICRVLEFIHLPQFIDRSHAYVLFEKLNRLVSKNSPLSDKEHDTAKNIFGSNAIQYEKVCIAENGLVGLVLNVLGNPAVTVFHTINLPKNSSLSRNDPNQGLETVIHELTHVYQFEHLGSRYITECLIAQHQVDYDCYNYGGAEGLRQARDTGKTLKGFDREQQASIVEGYLKDVIKKNLKVDDPDRLVYETYINELRKGEL